MALVYTGAVAPEAMAAWEALAEDIPGAGLLAVAVAQSGRASFSLNAPASFPVDI